MNIKNVLALSILSALCGAVYVAYMYDIIMIRLPGSTQELDKQQHCSIIKKNVKLYGWRHDKWHHESVELIWSEDMVDTLSRLIPAWLTMLEEEKMDQKKISLQSITISPHGQAYLSLDRNPFTKEASTFEKLMWVESLLKTIRDNGINLQSIQFLVHHQPLQDYHLDFSNPWPLTGFLTQAT